MPVPRHASLSPQGLAARLALEAIDLKAEDVCVLDVSELLYVTDFFVIATTQTARQTRSLAESLNLVAKELTGHKASIEGTLRSSWLLMDLGAVVVHILTADAREFYSLDALWADAPALALEDQAESA